MGLWRNLEARFATSESPWEHPTVGSQNFLNFFKTKFTEKKKLKKNVFSRKLQEFEQSYLEARFVTP